MASDAHTFHKIQEVPSRQGSEVGGSVMSRICCTMCDVKIIYYATWEESLLYLSDFNHSFTKPFGTHTFYQRGGGSAGPLCYLRNCCREIL